MRLISANFLVLFRDCQYLVSLVAAFHENRDKDFNYKWFVVEGMVLLIKEKYVQAVASTAWHGRFLRAGRQGIGWIQGDVGRPWQRPW